MKLLVAEDDTFFRRLLHQFLIAEWEVITVTDGHAAWDALQEAQGPIVAILDWIMPGMTGPEICRKARAHPKTSFSYLILLTARNSPEDILAGLRSGADDYLTKPFDQAELHARVRLGQRIVRLEQLLTNQIGEVESSRVRESLLQERLSALETSLQEHLAKASPQNGLRALSGEPASASAAAAYPVTAEKIPARSVPAASPVNNSKVL